MVNGIIACANDVFPCITIIISMISIANSLKRTRKLAYKNQHRNIKVWHKLKIARQHIIRDTLLGYLLVFWIYNELWSEPKGTSRALGYVDGCKSSASSWIKHAFRYTGTSDVPSCWSHRWFLLFPKRAELTVVVLIRSDARGLAGDGWDVWRKTEWSLPSNCQWKTRLRLRIMPQGLNLELQYLIWLVCFSVQGWPLYNNTVWYYQNYCLQILH